MKFTKSFDDKCYFSLYNILCEASIRKGIHVAVEMHFFIMEFAFLLNCVMYLLRDTSDL